MSTTTGDANDDADWFVECSDEEVYKDQAKGQLGLAKLTPNEAQRLYMQMDSHPDGVLPLVWKCPGRRPPTPSDEEVDTDQEDSGESGSVTPDVSGAAKNADFDFDDDDVGPAAITPRRPVGGTQRELKGSARKKQTSLRNVLSNMKRHQKIDAANRVRSGVGPRPTLHSATHK